MEVELYVYDLSNGLARTLSPVFLGIQIDAVYHTSIVIEGVEYVYDGGVKMVDPGKTHLGPPLDIKKLGRTELPLEVILEYIESMKSIYTLEAYDIFAHNCNNFSNDLSTFLIGHGIPEHITNLPATVLNTPFGRAIRPEIQAMVARNQAQSGGLVGLENSKEIIRARTSLVREPSSNTELEKMLEEAQRSCAVVFFTSPTCRPCVNLYPLYESLAREAAHKAIFIKVDITRAYDISNKYSIRATPTFQTFLHGAQENRWSGSDPSTLRGNIDILLRMAWPPHLHTALPLPTLLGASTSPVLYSKIPPLGKLKAKMTPVVSEDASIASVLNFISVRSTAGAAEATLPDLNAFSRFLRTAPSRLPPEILFTIVDLFRVALVDPRFSGYYAEESEHLTIAPLITYINNLSICPYSLKIVTLQMGCNLFSSPLYPEHILGCETLSRPIIDLITSSLLDVDHTNVRVAAASLAFNVTAANSVFRTENCQDQLPSDLQIELAASLLEAVKGEKESAEALKGYLLAFGLLVYCLPEMSDGKREGGKEEGGGMMDLLESLDAKGTLAKKKGLFPNERLIEDIVGVLLAEKRGGEKEGNSGAVPRGW